MSLSELEQHVFAYWVAGPAKELNIAGRFYPRGELVMIIADKVQVATRKFGRQVHSKSTAAATAFVDQMIEKGAWSTKQNDFGGTMHQFQPEPYRNAIAELQASDPVVQKAVAGGEGYWDQSFSRLAGS